MAVLAGWVATENEEHELLTAARAAGYCLFQYEIPTGQVVWEWRCADGPQPQFATRRVALHWMKAFLEHGRRRSADERIP